MPSASDREPGGGGGMRGVEGGGASFLEQGPATASGGPNAHQCGVPQGRVEGLLWLLPRVRVGR